MLAVDDAGNKYELAPDPMNEELQEQLKDIVTGKPETFKDQLKPILSNERLFSQIFIKLVWERRLRTCSGNDRRAGSCESYNS